ncbi:UbiA family prenyltransferase [Geoglobus acetivorans]|uniref:UbiA family prenyltransferase n=1 Tax=Geoglobus acetivorans TaxID=565033 RepID=UPI00187EFB9A|nr:UbiA prenyltransferase family protein [Geoglobus acetivorans]
MISEIFRCSIRPFNIIFPFPILPLVVAIFAGDIQSIWKPVLFTFLYYPANNLWNHINDAEDDFNAGKDTPLINEQVRKLAIWISTLFYLCSFTFLLFFSNYKYSILIYLVIFTATFLYSDNLLTHLRLKKHYLGEFFVYIVAVPTYVILMYSILKPPDLTTLKLVLLFTPIMISTLFIKDLKDISADKLAGLNTFAVRFHYKTLLKLFYFSLIVYFVLEFIVFWKDILQVAVLPLTIVIYSILKLYKENWEISHKSVEYIQYSIMSGILSLLIILLIKSFMLITLF